jgi:methylated-DNA-[protein]-cysteine S-methyltransferase
MAQKSVKDIFKESDFTCLLATPTGKLLLQSDGTSITAVNFIENEYFLADSSINLDGTEYIPPCLESCKNQLLEYFSGSRQQFDLPLAPSGTPFQQKVWEQLRLIPYGNTISYLDLAKRLGDPKVIRAAASANGKNPIAIIIPCHRVIGSNGDLTGYAGGLGNKKWLLELEQKVSGKISQLSLF